MATRRLDWRVPLVAMAIAAAAAGLYVFTARHPDPPVEPAPSVAVKTAREVEADGALHDGRPQKALPQLEPNLDLLTQCDGRAVAASARVRRLDQEPTRTRWTELWRGKSDS